MTCSDGFPFDEAQFSQMCRDAQVVKRNPVREVLKSGQFFIKHDRRRNKDFKAEFDNAKFVSSRGIPVVEHIGYASCDDGNYLVTRALENAVEVDQVSRDGKTDAAFCEKFVTFINLLREKRLKHKDLHGGNVLYVPQDHRFSLVDVKSVVRGIFPWYSDVDLQRLVTEVRLYLPRETIYQMLEKVGVGNGARFFERELRNDFKRVMHEWEKRHHQIMTGYRKFTRIDGHFILDRQAEKSEIDTARRFPARIEDFCTYYFLQLIRIPTARVIGYDLSCRELLWPQQREFAPAEKLRIDDLRDRLLVCGIETREEEWRCDHNGKTLLADLETVSRSLW